MIRRLGITVALAIFGAVVFRIGLSLFFPGEAIRERVLYEVSEASGGNLVMSMGDVSPWSVSGVSVGEGLQLLKAGEDDADPTVLVDFDSLAAKLELMSLISGDRVLRVEGEAYGGELELVGSMSETEATLKGGFEGADLSQYPITMQDGEQLNLAGELELSSDLELSLEEIEESSGSLSLEFDGLEILNEAFADTFEQAVLRLEIEDGMLKVEEGVFKGEKVDATIEGEVALNERIGRSRLDLRVKFTLDRSYDMLARAALRGGRAEDGTYHYKCTGTLSRRRCGVDRAAAGGGDRADRRRGARRNRGGDDDEADSPRRSRRSTERIRPDEGREERRERVRQRREERRARLRERRGDRDRVDPTVEPATDRERPGEVFDPPDGFRDDGAPMLDDEFDIDQEPTLDDLEDAFEEDVVPDLLDDEGY